MTFTISMKTPDAVETAVRDALIKVDDDGNELEIDEESVEELMELCKKWFSWGEYVQLEVDTEAKTCKVLGA